MDQSLSHEGAHRREPQQHILHPQPVRLPKVQHLGFLIWKSYFLQHQKPQQQIPIEQPDIKEPQQLHHQQLHNKVWHINKTAEGGQVYIY